MSKKTKSVGTQQVSQEKIEVREYSRWFYYAIILAEGFLIMGTELLGSGLIAPHFGSSLTVWTFVLGITMSALAAGYFFGAYLSKKNKFERHIGALLLCASLSIFFMPDIRSWLFRTQLEFDLIPLLLLCVTPLLFLPLFFLGSLSPLLIKRLSEISSETGYSAGKVYALSTLGGVAAALFTAFIMLDFTSVAKSIYCFSMIGFSCLFLAFHTFGQGRKKWLSMATMLLLSLIFFKSSSKRFDEVLPSGYDQTYFDDGILGQLRVVDNYRNKSRSLFVNNTVQSISTLDGKAIWEYVAKISTIVNQRKNSRVLLAGLGGGILNNEISSKQGAIDIVDMDARMLEICEQHFNYKLAAKDHFFADDIRHFVRSTSQKYDFIILDLSAAENVPVNMYTREGFSEISKILNPNGILLIHYFCNLEQDGIRTLKALGNTMKSGGLHAVLLQTEHRKDELSSMVFVAGNSTLPKIDQKLTPLFPFSFNGGEILTDDKPKLDMLRKNMASQTRNVYIKNYLQIWETIRKYQIKP